MEIKEVVTKLAGIDAVKEAIGEDGLKALTSALGSVAEMEKRLKDSEAKAGRILAEKKEAQEKLSVLEADVETLKKSGLSEADKIKSDFEKALKRAEKAEKDLQSVQADYGKARRAVALDKIASGVKFIDAISPDAGRILLEASMNAIDNLEDPEKISAALTDFKEKHKSMIAADSQATGAGTGRPAGSANGGSQQKSPDKQTDQERAAYLRAQSRHATPIHKT